MSISSRDMLARRRYVPELLRSGRQPRFGRMYKADRGDPLGRPWWWWMMNEGSGQICHDLMGRNHMTMNNMDQSDWVCGRNGRYGLEYDGNLNYATTENTSAYPDKDVSIAVWYAKTGSVSGEKALLDMMTSSFYPGVGLYYRNLSDNLNVYINSSTSVNIYVSLSGINLNEWNHLVVTKRYSEAYAKVYLNGIEQSVTLGLSRENENIAHTQPVKLGGLTSGYRWEGKLADVRIYDFVLSLFQVQRIYLGAISLCPIVPFFAPASAPVSGLPVYLGSQQLQSVYLGSQEIQSIHKGNTQLWP